MQAYGRSLEIGKWAISRKIGGCGKVPTFGAEEAKRIFILAMKVQRS
jgi:hypothetical protein